MSLEEEIAELKRQLRNTELELTVALANLSIAEKALKTYADKNFWIRFPTYTLASADKGQIAAQALRDAYAPDSSA